MIHLIGNLRYSSLHLFSVLAYLYACILLSLGLLCLYVCMYLCMYIRMYLHTYLSIYLYYAYVASRQIEELQKLDTQECPVVIRSNVDTMDISFLLCSSGNLGWHLTTFLVFNKLFVQNIYTYICTYVYKCSSYFSYLSTYRTYITTTMHMFVLVYVITIQIYLCVANLHSENTVRSGSINRFPRSHTH